MSSPVSISLVVDQLQYVLREELKVTGPLVGVGFGFGGLVSRVFCSQNLDLCQGLLLVDSWHEELLLKDYWRKLLPPSRDDKDGDQDRKKVWLGYDEIGSSNEFPLWWKGIWNSFGWNLQMSWLLKHHGSRDRIMGREMKYQEKFLRMKFLESVTSSILSYKEVVKSNDNLKNIKTSVVSSKEMIKRSVQWGDWQRTLTKISQNTKEWTIVEGDHNIYKFGVGKDQLQYVLLRLLED